LKPVPAGRIYVMFRIEQLPAEPGYAVTLQISGILGASARDEIADVVDRVLGGSQAVALDLSDVTGVDREVVVWLAARLGPAVSLVGCPAYLARWLQDERRHAGDPPAP
jgi:hypothetical protein